MAIPGLIAWLASAEGVLQVTGGRVTGKLGGC